MTCRKYTDILVVMTTLNMSNNHLVEALAVPLDERIGFLIYRAHTLGIVTLRRALQAGGHDITPEQLSVLARIREQEGMNQSQLAQKVFKDRHNITRILGLLEKKGLVQRRPDQSDNRAYRLYLSEVGRTTLEKVTPIYINHWREQLSGLSREDIAVLRRILGHISNNLEKVLSRL